MQFDDDLGRRIVRHRLGEHSRESIAICQCAGDRRVLMYLIENEDPPLASRVEPNSTAERTGPELYFESFKRLSVSIARAALSTSPDCD